MTAMLRLCHLKRLISSRRLWTQNNSSRMTWLQWTKTTQIYASFKRIAQRMWPSFKAYSKIASKILPSLQHTLSTCPTKSKICATAVISATAISSASFISGIYHSNQKYRLAFQKSKGLLYLHHPNSSMLLATLISKATSEPFQWVKRAMMMKIWWTFQGSSHSRTRSTSPLSVRSNTCASRKRLPLLSSPPTPSKMIIRIKKT